jgi:cobalt-zinc-cadmium efflux system membrane fusion protein
LGRRIPGIFALALIAGLMWLGFRTGWRLPKFSVLMGRSTAPADDWCEEHAVPDSICVECKKDCMPRQKEFGWCRNHLVHECPYCHPEVAQLPALPAITSADLERAQRALAMPRTENNSKCRLQQRLIQFASVDTAAQIGLSVAPVGRADVIESIAVFGETGFDTTKVARVSPRSGGKLVRVVRQVGDSVHAGEVLALIDAAEVGKAKAEYLQARAQLDVKSKTLAAVRERAQIVSERAFREAEIGVEEATLRLLAAEQALVNLGLPAPDKQWAALPGAEFAAKMRFLGIPTHIAATLDTNATSNLIAVTSPVDGIIVTNDAAAGANVEIAKAMFVVADLRSMWLTLELPLEDARRIGIGHAVQFQPDAGGNYTGKIMWLSTAVDEKTRTVRARAALANSDGRLRAKAFGSGRIILRDEVQAIVVPQTALHWEGDCHVVFVRDRNYDQPDAKKVFHVRKVVPGATIGKNVEIISGVLPGELIAVDGSGILRSELLKGSLGAG